MLGPKIEGLPDDHPSKPQCLFRLSWLFEGVGNNMEYKQLLTCTLKLYQGQGNHSLVAQTLRFIASANRILGLPREGIQQAREALEIYKQSNDISGQGHTWQELAWLLYEDNQLDAAEEAASNAIDLLSDPSDQFIVCECYHALGNIYHLRGKKEETINHFETALRIATTFNWHGKLFWIHYSMAEVFSNEGGFDDACIHIELAKSHAINDMYLLARTTHLQATFWHRQHRFKEAKSRALDAANVFEKLGAARDLEVCKGLLQDIEMEMNKPMA